MQAVTKPKEYAKEYKREKPDGHLPCDARAGIKNLSLRFPSVQGKKLVSTGDDQFNVNDVYLHFYNAGKAYPSQYPRFYINHTKTQTRIGYDPDRPRISVKKIRKASDLIP